MPSIAIVTLCVGPDYKREMEPGLQSKREYAARHGYDFLCGGEDVWDREKPIPWSKFHLLLKYIDQYDYLFWSDADAIILRQELRLEDHVLRLLPTRKDLLWTFDACEHLNNGHMLIRGKSSWAKNFFERCLQQEDLLYHIWWDNAAMIKLYETVPNDAAKIETLRDHWIMNSYIFGPNGKAGDSVRLYKHGDFLVHFAGVYKPGAIHALMLYVLQQSKEGKEVDPNYCDYLRLK